MSSTYRGMLVQGNTHLGSDIWTFSIPASLTCPGLTEACLMVCYALKFARYARSALDKHAANWQRTKEPTFARDMVEEIRFRRCKTVRIHVAGDFYDAAYIAAWLYIASRCKRTEFLFYTRSWRIPDLRAPLIELACLPNVRAWWSEDRDTGPSDMPVGRRCYLCASPDDEATVPPGVLVFREKTKGVRKWVGTSWVCPKENGTKAGITCSACRFCTGDAALPRKPEDRGRDGSASVPEARKGASA